MKVKTNAQISGIRFFAVSDVPLDKWVVSEYDGKVKQDEDGNPLYRGGTLIMINGEGEAVKDQVSFTIAEPIELKKMTQYVPVGDFIVNSYDRFKTSVQLKGLAEVKG